MATFIPNVTDVFPDPSLFNPDFALIDKFLQRREDLYNKGFAEVNKVYSLINRKTLNPINGKVKEQFLRQAKDNLKNLSALDLSQSENVRAATNVFSPFYNNMNVLGDQAYTEYTDQQKQLGESYRNQDGGKYFNQDNIDYITQQQMAFAQDSPETWSQYWGAKRGYTPYYNVDEERLKLMDKFKPDHVKTVQVKGLYKTVVDDKSWYEGQIANFLEKNYSEKAKQQLRISGAVKYGNNLPLLSQQYTAIANEQLPRIKQELLEIDGQMKKERDPDKLDMLDQKRQYFESQQTAITGNLDAIESGDMSLVKRKSEDLAYDLYFREHIKDAASAFAHKDIEEDNNFAEVAKMLWENDEKWRLEKWKRANEVEDRELTWTRSVIKANMEKDAKDKEGTLALIPGGGAGETFETSSKRLALKKIQILYNDTEDAKDNLVDHMAIELGKPADRITLTDLRDFIAANPADNYVYDYVSKHNAAMLAENSYESYNTNANKYVATKMGTDKFLRYSDLQKSGQTNTVEYKALNEAYEAYYKEYHGPAMRMVSVNRMSYGLNPADKRFAGAAGVFSSYSGVDKSLVGSVEYTPNIKGGMDIRYQVQKDPAKPAWEAAVAKANLESKLGAVGATYVYDDKTNTFTIKNAPKILWEDFDPYKGLDYSTRNALDGISTYDVPKRGDYEAFVPMRSGVDGTNFVFKIRKHKDNSGAVKYYVYNNRNRLLTSSSDGVNPLESTEQVGQTLNNLTKIYTSQQLKELLALPPK